MNEFCNVTVDSQCKTVISGTCQTLGSANLTTFNGHSFAVSARALNEFAAEKWCAKHDGHIASLSDLGLYPSQWDWWADKNYSCGIYSLKDECPEVNWNAFYAAFNPSRENSMSLWTTDLIADTNTNCHTQIVKLFTNGAGIGYENRASANANYALCIQ